MRYWLPIAIACAVLTAPSVVAVEPLPPARTDSYGDALPKGVLARLGSTRFRSDFNPSHLEISPDGALVAVADFDGHIDIFAWPSGSAVRKFDGRFFQKGEIIEIVSIHFAADSKKLMVVGTERTVEIDIERNRWIVRSDSAGGIPKCISPDLRYIVTQRRSNGPIPSFALYLHDLNETRPTARRIGNATATEDELAVAISHDNRWLALMTPGDPLSPERIYILNLRTGKAVAAVAGNYRTLRLEFAPDGRSLLAVGSKLVLLHPLALPTDDKTPARIGPSKTIFIDGDNTPLASFANRGRDILIASRGLAVMLYDVASRRIRKSIPVGATVGTVRMSPDGRWLATLDEYASAPSFRNVADGGPILDQRGHTSGVVELAFSQDGRTLYSASLDGTVKTWTVAPHRGVRQVALGSARTVAEERWPSREILTRRTGRILVNLHLDESRSSLISRTEIGELFEWNLRSKTPCVELPRSLASSTVWSPSEDGGSLAVVREDLKTVDLVEFRTGRSLHSITTTRSIVSTKFHPDGRTLLTSGGLDDVVAWDIRTGAALPEVPAFDRGLARRAWIERHEGELVVRDRATGRPQFSIDGIEGWVGFALSRDERVLIVVAGSEIRRYELPSGRMRSLGGSDAIGSIAISPDASLVAVGLNNGEIRLLDQRPYPRDPDVPASPREWEALWASLVESNRDERAQASLVRQYPAETIRVLGRRHLSAKPPTPQRVVELLKQLDDNKYARREAAMRELRRDNTTIRATLEAFLKTRPSPEVETRVRRLIQEGATLPPSGERLRNLRIVGVLEGIGTPDVVPLLREYAASQDPMLSTQAKDSLVRLRK